MVLASERDIATGAACYFMRTARIGFRVWTAEDLPLALALWGDPQVTGLIADLGRPSPEQAQKRLAREMVNRETFGVQYWPIFLLEGGEHLGCCGLRPFRPEDGVFEIGAHLHPRHWGQGYATEALRAAIAHAFGPVGVQALFARHNPKNHGSRGILAKLGFHYTHDDFLPQTGLNHPSYLLRADGGMAGCKPVQQVILRAEDPAKPEVRRLIELLDAYQSVMYPPESLHLAPVESLRQPEVTFLAARVEGEIAGCGALVNQGDYGELKRMFVLPEHRSLGIGRRILEMLEARARCLGLHLVRLETGDCQPEALRLYAQAGYQRRGHFGAYAPDPLTVYMEKKLPPWVD